MHGATYNLKYGRDPERVRNEAINLLHDFDLDWLALQETNDYYDCLRGIPGYRYFTGHSENGGAQREVAIIVNAKHDVDGLKSRAWGDGWQGQGFRMRPRVFLSLIIDDTHKVATGHMPPRTNLATHTPPDRYDDYVALAKRTKRYFTYPSRFSRTVAMDFNTWPSNENKFSPAWIAKKTGATLVSPDNKLDYFLMKGRNVEQVLKVKNFNEKSDHDPVVVISRPKR